MPCTGCRHVRREAPGSIPLPSSASHTRATTRTTRRPSTGHPPGTTREPPPATIATIARMIPAAHIHARRPGGGGRPAAAAADVLIHQPVPKKKAKWRIRGCGATSSSPRPQASDRTLCAPNGVLRGLVKVCQANLRRWGKVRRKVEVGLP
jgi:hypothetical protein